MHREWQLRRLLRQPSEDRLRSLTGPSTTRIPREIRETPLARERNRLDPRRATDRREPAVRWRFGVSAGAGRISRRKSAESAPRGFPLFAPAARKERGWVVRRTLVRYRVISLRTEASPRSRSRRSPAAHHAPCSPLGSPRTMKSREHKLDICFDFTRGSCRRGDGCRFSHNLPPGGVIPPRPKTAGVCFDYTKGICNRGCVSRRSRRPRRDLRRDFARPVMRERRRRSKSANAF